jgi:hypothetical protein
MPQPSAGGCLPRRPPSTARRPKKQAPTPSRRLSRRPHAPQAPRLHRCRPHDRPTIDTADADPGSAVRDRLVRVGTGGAMKSSRIALTVLGRLGRLRLPPGKGRRRFAASGKDCHAAARVPHVNQPPAPTAGLVPTKPPTRQLEGFAQFIQRVDGYGFAVSASPVPAFGRTDFHPRLPATFASGDF